MCLNIKVAENKGKSIEETGWNWDIYFSVSAGEWKIRVTEPEDRYPSGSVHADTACEAIERAHIWIRAVTEATERANRPQI